MDIIELIHSSGQNFGSIFSTTWFHYLLQDLQSTFVMYFVIGLLTLIVIAWYINVKRTQRRKEKERLEQSANADMRGLRFRKRDKMIFYGKRMLRKVKNVSGQMYGGQGRKRRAVVRFAKRLLKLRQDNLPAQMRTVEPPAEYLEETIEGSERVPKDALYMLQSIRIFGHFEKPIFLKLCKHTEVVNLEAGDYLFKITDNDDSVFIVQSGQIHVFISTADGGTLSLKHVKQGESVTSLLSFIDVLSGNPSFYKTVTARAVEKSVVIRLPMQAFEQVFQENPDIMIRVIQVIMVRLQRVLFTALRNYLGLNSELVQSHMRQKRQAHLLKYSPGHRRSIQSEAGGGFQHTLHDNARPPDMLVDLAVDTHHSSFSQQHQFGEGGSEDKTGKDSRRQSSVLPPAEWLNPNSSIDLSSVQIAAVECFLNELGLEESDKPLLATFVEVREVEAGTTLLTEGNSEDVCIFLVMIGGLSVHQAAVDATRTIKVDATEVFVYNVHPGEIVGGLAVLTGEASTYTIRTRYQSTVAFMRRSGIYQIMREKPRIVLDLGSGVVRRLSPLVRQCDYALDWIFLESGRAVYRQDEMSDSTYIVLSGRMRSVITNENGKKEIVGEYGKGDLVGLVEMLTETGRTTTVMAVRDSELAKLPEGLFNAIKFRYPIVVTKLIGLLSHRLLGTMQATRGDNAAPYEANPVTHKYSTVALVPVSDEVPVTAFSYELYHSLSAIGPTLRLTSEVMKTELGTQIFEPRNDFRLTSWLAQQEDRHAITLYQCDSSLSVWTQRCMRQADVILIIGLGERSPNVGKFEREIDRLAMRTQKELVLLYHESTTAPTNTINWLINRPWVTKHHHLLCSKRMFTRRSQYRINDLYSRVLMSQPNMHSDFSRLARWLTGNSIGLVLGGGGAKGAAHIGMIKAMNEAGIPIDMVGGVSIGALMGALWCSERNITTMTQKAREWAKKMTKVFLQLMDLTYPLTSMFSGRGFNRTIRETVGDVSIEDLWIPYFTLTTDITASSHRIHTHGSLWRYIRSSMSLSSYLPPLCDPTDGHLLLDGGYINNLPGILWRYVRASMSIAGVLPPMCDSADNHLLVDGCYINNVPADVMRNLGAAHIIAIDVGTQDDGPLTNYGDDLSGWWLLWKKWNPFTTPVKVPDMHEIQSRLAYVSCNKQLLVVKKSDYCEYVRPPIDKYKTLAFGQFDEIRDVGYVFGKNHFEKMDEAGRLGRFNKWLSKEPPTKDYHHSLNEYTFIDLAQIVCKLPETGAEQKLVHQFPQQSSYLFSEDEDFDGYISEPSTLNGFRRLKMKRTGTSLSLSENEMDSDIEVDLTLDLKSNHSRDSPHRARGSPQSPSFISARSALDLSTATPSAKINNEDGLNESTAKITTGNDEYRIEDLPMDSDDEDRMQRIANRKQQNDKKNEHKKENGKRNGEKD